PGADRGLDAVGSMRAGGGSHARLVGFLHPGAKLLVGQLLRSRLNPWCHDAARGDQLDAIAASPELLADRLADLVRAVRLAPDPRPMTAGHADHLVGGDDPRALHQSAGLRVAQ